MDSCKEESFIFYIMKKGTPERSPQQALVFFSDLLRKEHRPCDRPAIIQNANFVSLGEVKKGQIPVFGAFWPLFRVFAYEQGFFRLLQIGCDALPLPAYFFWFAELVFMGSSRTAPPTDASKNLKKSLESTFNLFAKEARPQSCESFCAYASGHGAFLRCLAKGEPWILRD